MVDLFALHLLMYSHERSVLAHSMLHFLTNYLHTVVSILTRRVKIINSHKIRTTTDLVNKALFDGASLHQRSRFFFQLHRWRWNCFGDLFGKTLFMIDEVAKLSIIPLLFSFFSSFSPHFLPARYCDLALLPHRPWSLPSGPPWRPTHLSSAVALPPLTLLLGGGPRTWVGASGAIIFFGFIPP